MSSQVLPAKQPSSSETIPSLAKTNQEHPAFAFDKPLEERRAEQIHAAPSFSHIDAAPTHASSDRKLEHMTLQSLLVLAHGVHLGYGQYLKEEFEKGNIDKDGLIKVLKARAKGKDFSREFREQVAHYRQLKISPEFLREDRLRKAQPVITDVQKEERLATDTAPNAQATPTSAPQSSPILPQPITTPATPAARDKTEPAPTKETDRNLWVTAIIIGLIILGFLIWTLL